MGKFRYCCAAALIIAVIVCIAVFVRRKCPDGRFSRAAVAADSHTCSEIGRDILQKGGSAVDGAIAALLCTSIINAQSMGIGGGAIFTVMDSSGKVKIINSRETVPRNFNPGLLKSCPKTFQMTPGSAWIGVPGELRGYAEAHRLYGKLPWSDLFQPTIKLARDGFPIPDVQGQYIATHVNTSESPALREFYSDKDGNPLKAGDIIKFEKLADTLETIANDGAEAFYSGRIAEDLIRDIQEAGGTLTMQDLAEYNVAVTDAWAVPLGEYQMYIPPPPAGGVVLSLILNIMKGYHLNSEDMKGEKKTLTYHRFVEALRFAKDLKRRIRDLKFSPEKEGWAKNLTEETQADLIRMQITNKTHGPEYYNTQFMDSMGTTHVSVLAEDGSAVSVSSSIDDIFGSRILSPSTGVILNNQLTDFCNREFDNISPGEQPPSSMAPAVLKSQSKTLVIGASGGDMITPAMALTLMNHLWFGKSLGEAINASIVFVDRENKLRFEAAFDKDVIEGLKALGHEEVPAKKFYNVVNVVEKVDGCILAVSDERKKGKAAGY
ncbi:gamma-glutamyltransferase 5a [Symphorus nematophorus]